MREYLFAADTGFYVVDKPAFFGWGPGELDRRKFTVIRTVKPSTDKFFADSHALLVDRKMRLKQPLRHSGHDDNIWRDGALEKTPERAWRPAPEYVVLRTGRRCKEEDELWGCVIEGDRVFHSPNPQDPEAKGMLLTVLSVEPRRFDLKTEVTLEEAECLRT